MFEKNMIKHSETHKRMDELVHQGHMEKNKQKCSICSKRFSKKHFLRKHIERVHEGKKPHNAEFVIIDVQIQQL